MFGLSGAHRSGKTTLAKAVSEERGLEFVTISTVEVMRKAGYDFDDVKTLGDRIYVQRKIIEACDKVFQGRKTHFISDRTPIDVAAYLMADVNGQAPGDMAQEILDMVDDCIDITNACFGGVVLIEPHLPYKPESGKPRPNEAYQWHHHYICQGLLSAPKTRLPFWIFNDQMTDLGERKNLVGEIYDALIEDDVSISQVVPLH